MRLQIMTLIAFCASTALAQVTPEASPVESPVWTNESELGIATVSGNTKSETYTLKETTGFQIDKLNKVALSGRYLRSESSGVESSRNWDAALRFERSFSQKLAAYLQYGLESDIFAGYMQRNNSDIGLKYDLARSTPTTWFVELGYRNTVTIPVGSPGTTTTDFARLFTEASQKLGEQTSLRLWIEYLPSLESGDDYRINFEPSLITQLSGAFSLKTSYLVKYQNRPVAPATETSDRFLTTALVAKF